MANAGLTILALTFNLWGIPDFGFQVLAPLREERIAKVCEELNKSKWDIVLLQELWVLKNRDKLLKCGYPHAVDLENRKIPIDSGLLILSRYPVEKASRLTYPAPPLTTTPSDDGEDLVRKSAIAARVLHPDRPFWVANTHLVAQYTDSDPYLERRRQQMRAYTKWARDLAKDEPLVLGGDFNYQPDSKLATEAGEWLPKFTESPEAAKTCTICPPNTMHAVNEGRVDYLMGSGHFKVSRGRIALDVPLTVDGVDISLSDHFGFESRFETLID